MRVLVAGATGVIGRQLVPLLIAVGHQVVALSRTGRRSAALEALGAERVFADALDPVAIGRAVREAAPDAVVNLLTAVPAEVDPKHLARDLETTNRLRTEGTRHLLEAAIRAGARRVISEGVAYAYDPDGDGLATEETPLWRRPPASFAPVLEALRSLERHTDEAGGLVLRFGHLYGPGSAFSSEGSFVRQVRARRVPLVGGGTATFSFTHVHDAATAILAALDKEVAGVLNVVDDTPAPMCEWLPFMAKLLGAPPPGRAPAILARMAVGGWGLAFLTRLRGAQNAGAKCALDWRPRYASWEEGFVAELAPGAGAAVH